MNKPSTIIKNLVDDIFNLIDDSENLEEHDFLVKEFFNYCISEAGMHEKKENPEKNLDIMFVVSVLLPKIINASYQKSVIDLMELLTYKNLPYDEHHKKKFASTRKHLR